MEDILCLDGKLVVILRRTGKQMLELIDTLLTSLYPYWIRANHNWNNTGKCW
jgi:hypothetical protein